MTDIETTNSKPFEIALVLAGAVACGSYLAGFLDHLLDTLDAWEEAKKGGDTEVPQHQVKIKVIAGASAGGMSAAIFIREAFRRAKLRREGQPVNSEDSLLKKAWVESIDISDLLKNQDLKEGSVVESLLDCTRIDEVAKEILCDGSNYPEWEHIPYFDAEIKAYLTLTNLKGLSYKLRFTSDTNSGHQFINHADYEYFEFSEEVFKSSKKDWNNEWEKLKKRAIATGAFPIALKPREINGRCYDFYKNRLKEEGRGLDEHLDVNKDGDFSFYAIDGGTINNEPFDLAKSVWATVDGNEEFQDQGKFTLGENCVIMVDPFPGEGILETHSKSSRWFYSFIPDLISTLLNQSRFRVEEIREWSKMEEGTRFLVMPRKEENGQISSKPLKGGFLGGFGGFFSKKFREHDYELGKANCKSFLENYLTLPAKPKLKNKRDHGEPQTGVAKGNSSEVSYQNDIFGKLPESLIFHNQNELDVFPLIYSTPEIKKSKFETNADCKIDSNKFKEIKKGIWRRLTQIIWKLPLSIKILNISFIAWIPIIYLLVTNPWFGKWGNQIHTDLKFVLDFFSAGFILVGLILWYVKRKIYNKLVLELEESMRLWGVYDEYKS
jgi:predicted acylesterase/phospholipase RssA